MTSMKLLGVFEIGGGVDVSRLTYLDCEVITEPVL